MNHLGNNERRHQKIRSHLDIALELQSNIHHANEPCLRIYHRQSATKIPYNLQQVPLTLVYLYSHFVP